jgi:integrase
MSRKGRANDGLYKRGDRWYTKVKINGAWVEKGTRTCDYNEARKIRRELQQAALDDALPNDRRRCKLDKALQDWLNFQMASRKHGFHAHERTIVKNLLAVFGHDKRLESFTAYDLHNYQVRRLATVKHKTINNELQVIRSVLKLANVWRRLEQNYEPLRVEQSRIGRALSLEEATRLLRAGESKDLWHVALCAAVLALHTGMRSYEIKSLRLADLHLEDPIPFLSVRRENTKTSAGVRDVALNRDALWSIETLRARAAALGSIAPHHHLLPANLAKRTRSGAQLTGFDPEEPQTSWTSAWRSLTAAAGLAGLRFHDLRHSHISWALAEGAATESVRSQVGHSNTSMTIYYSHQSLFDKTQAVMRVQEHARELSVTLDSREQQEHNRKT